ncbi:hypothetical protein J2Z22_000912 [Paenibacillus forsythiae]|uniref:Uncharacterized protein n=1 Tax=Paenibacillus forsythiae TaxID=365616 RepID=A0ABU3H3J6_9BACL|nr:hypothetical protein [Paenibacillus forsythiae]MDT3425396.1 hypothetical protein [Paenibacillus forsythiae]
MSISAKVNGQFTPEFAAYTHLALANRIQNQVRGISSGTKTNSMNFKQFMEAIQKDQEVNHSYVRHVSADEEANNRVYGRNNGVNEFANQRFATIEKAYELGLVDRSGILMASFHTEA